MVTDVCNDRPIPSYPANFVQEEDIHLTMVGLEIVGVVSVKNETIYTPLIIRAPLFFLEPFGKNVVESVIQGLIGAINDGSPVGNYSELKRQISLNSNIVTVGISTSNSSEGTASEGSISLDPNSWYLKLTISFLSLKIAGQVCT